MCGISGYINKKQDMISIQDRIVEMNRLIAHRGPDGEGSYFHENVGFGHRRLAILDLSKDGHQPMSYQNEQLVITYNGEIYNYLELRNDLEQLGYLFKSHTDTEVILAAYAEWGEECVTRFNGMWAFAILDKQKQIIFCSRDRFGVKPFYYSTLSDAFIFGSEIRQLLPYLKSVSANKNKVLDFILTSISDHSTETFFQDVIKLSPGHNLIYKLHSNEIQINRYYEVSYNAEFAKMSSNEAIQSYFGLLEDAVRLRLRSDVRVGTCLSGGLDSSTVATLASMNYMNNNETKFSAITAVSEQASNDESSYAKQVVDSSNLDWMRVKPTYQNFLETLDSVVLAQEEPFGSPSLTMQYFVMKEARNNGIPVLLDGQGGDETLLGYEKYYGSYLVSTLKNSGPKAFYQAVQSMRANNSKMSYLNTLKYLLGTTMARLRYRYYCNRHSYLREKLVLPEHLVKFSKSIWDAFILQKLEIESTNLPVLLRYEDKNSMAHSIETRLPFLDYRVVEAALSIPGHYKIHNGWSKWLLRKGMEGRMPDSIVWRKNKFGFEAPEAIWLKRHSEEMGRVVLSSTLLGKLTNSEVLRSKFAKLDFRTQWRLYSIALWERAFNVIS